MTASPAANVPFAKTDAGLTQADGTGTTITELAPADLAARNAAKVAAIRAARNSGLTGLFTSYDLRAPALNEEEIAASDPDRTLPSQVFTGWKYGEKVSDVEVVAGGWNGELLDGFSVRVISPPEHAGIEGGHRVMVGYLIDEVTVMEQARDRFGRLQWASDNITPVMQRRLTRRGRPVISRTWGIVTTNAIGELEDAQELARLVADEMVTLIAGSEFKSATADARDGDTDSDAADAPKDGWDF